MIAGTAWRQELSCRLFAFTHGVSRRLTLKTGKRSACSFPFLVFGNDGFPFKTKIRTILENLMLSASLTRENISVFAFFIQQRKNFSSIKRTFSPKQLQIAPIKDVNLRLFSRQVFAARFVLFFLLPATSDYRTFPISSFPAKQNPDSSTL